MKKYLLISLFVFILVSCGYEQGVSEAFMKYRFKEGVTTVTIPGWVIGMASNFADDLDEDERELLESIDKVRILSVENEDLNARVNLHDEFFETLDKNRDYEELLVVRDDNDNITVFGKMNENIIREMVILVGGNDNALIYLKGEIRPELLNNKIDLSTPGKFLSFSH